MERTDGLSWRKSSFSGGNGGACVEVGTTAAGHAVGIRDSKRPEAGHLAVNRETFAALLADVKAGRRDLA